MREMRDSGFGYIGQIPQAWSIGKLKQFFEKSNVTNHPDDTVLSLYRDYGVIPKDSRDDNHNVTSLDTSKYKHVDVGDFVINKMKGWQGSMALSPYEGIVSPAYHVFKFRSSELYPKYAHYLLRCRSFADEWRRLSTGLRVGQWDLHVEDFLNTCIPHPPLDEQRRIADSLDERCADIDAAIGAAEKSIDEYKTYRQAIIYEAITGKVGNNDLVASGISWIALLPRNWSVVSVGDLFSCRAEKVSDEDYPPLSVTKLGVLPQLATAAKSDDHANRKLLRKGDFAINSRSDRRNSCGFAPMDGSVSLINTVCVPRVEMESRYFGYLFKTPQWADEFYSWGHGIVADLWTTSWNEMKKIILPQPPLDEQKHIADYLDAKCAEMEQVIAAKQSIIADLKTYKQSLVYEVVTGKREVR